MSRVELSSCFTELADRVLAAGGVGVLWRAVAPGHAGMPQDASLMDQARLIVCLEGRVGFGMTRGEGAGEVTLNPRDGLFVAPGRWVRARARTSYVSMGVVFYAESTRFYLMRSGATRGGHPGTPVETHIVPTGLGEDGIALVRMLSGPEPAIAAERYFHHAFECLLIAARELLARPAAAPAGSKARFTWRAACDFMLDHLHRPLSRKDVARHLGVHPNHLSRLFGEFGSESFGGYLLARRLERARMLLADPKLNIAEVARLSGFGSANYFTRVFRAQTGRPPASARGSEYLALGSATPRQASAHQGRTTASRTGRDESRQEARGKRRGMDLTAVQGRESSP